MRLPGPGSGLSSRGCWPGGSQMTIGEMVLQRRQQMGKSRLWLSKESGVHETTLWNIEYGYTKRPNDRTVARIAAALQIPLAEFELEKQAPVVKKREFCPRYREGREHTGRTLEQAAEELRIKVGGTADQGRSTGKDRGRAGLRDGAAADPHV